MMKKYITKYIYIILSLIALISVYYWVSNKVNDNNLNINDSRLYLNLNESQVPVTDSTGAIPSTTKNLVAPESEINLLLYDKLPIYTESFDILKGDDMQIYVKTKGSNYKVSLLEFYDWLELNGYGKIDLSKIVIN